MVRFNKITIIGVGLIGGSIGLAVKKRRLAREVIGVFRHDATRRKALRRGAVDRGVMDLATGVSDADLIIIATPVHSIPKLVRQARAHAKPSAVITDAGSTKDWIVLSVEESRPAGRSAPFVGSHPMAGSEHTSVAYARENLIEDAACIVTGTRRTDPAAMRRVSSFWRALGGRVSVMTPEGHDAAVAMISHLPHMVAFALAGCVDRRDLRYAAEGFKDTTRVASSDAELWADIFLTNTKGLARSVRVFQKDLTALARAVKRLDRRKLVTIMKAAKAKRDRSLS